MHTNFPQVLKELREDDHSLFTAQIKSLPSDAELLCGKNDTRYSNWFSGVGATLLQITAFLRPKFAPDLLKLGVTIDLHSACALGDVDSIDRILTNDPSALEHQVDTYYPIQFALRHPAALDSLLERGDDANRPLRKVAWFEWEDQAADRGVSDWRLLHMVALGRGAEPHLVAAETLKKLGADLNSVSSPFGEAPIHLSAIYNRTHLIRWFVDNGVDVDTKTVDAGQTSARTDLFDTVPFAPFDTYRQTPLMLALGEGQSEAANLLLDLGADIHATDSAGFTPLHYAAGAFWQENQSLVEQLIERGASTDAMALDKRPIDLAKAKGYANTTSVLLR